MFRVPNHLRVRDGPLGSADSIGNYGAFLVPLAPLRVIASEAGGWEHASASLPHRCPTWDEMCLVKAFFWDAEDAAMQLHPPASFYVNHHPFALHLWRPIGALIPLPPTWMVGPATSERKSK